MELYVPYIVGSTVSAFLGKIVYSYLTYRDISGDNISDDNISGDNISDINKIDEFEINKNDYELINNKGIKERYWKPLGVTFVEKSKMIKQICKDECGIHIIKDIKSKKDRSKSLFYISQYGKLGHEDFVQRFIKKKYYK